MLDRYSLDQSVADGALVWLEVLRCPDGPRIADASLQTLQRVCDINGGRTFAAIFGGVDLKPLYPIIFGFGVGTIYHVRDKDSECYDSNVYSITLCDIIDRISPAVVAFGATDRGDQLAEKVSSMLAIEPYKDCTEISMEGRILSTEPAPLNQFLMDNRRKFPQVCTLSEGSYEAVEGRTGHGTAIYWQTWKE